MIYKKIKRLLTRVSVIDIGSNSVRMAIFEQNGKYAFSPIYEIKSGVRISENSYKNSKNLQPQAIKRAYLALKEFVDISNSYNSSKIYCVATSAVRDAPNKDKFISLIKKKLNLNIDVIDGETEAYYGGVACANLLEPLEAVTIDIGGGSTELSRIKNQSISNPVSLYLGTVRLKELFFDANSIDKAEKYIDREFEKIGLKSFDTAVGVGGTFRALANIIKDKSNYPLDIIHGFTFEAKSLEKLIGRILQASNDELLDIGVKKERVDVIKPGSLILLRFIKRFGIKRFVTSGAGVRDGVYIQKIYDNKIPKKINPSIEYIINKYTSSRKYIQDVSLVAKELFGLLQKPLKLSADYKDIFLNSVKLATIGSALNFYSYHQHSYYFILNSLKYKLAHTEVITIATLVRYQKRKRPSHKHLNFYKKILPKERDLNILSYLLFLSYALLTSHPSKIKYNFSYKNKTLYIQAPKTLYLTKELLDKSSNKYFNIKFINM
jgi:exopolyphosphatase/guanosine-5'-triphosphate,3'-diphosphate pyrophosphatase